MKRLINEGPEGVYVTVRKQYSRSDIREYQRSIPTKGHLDLADGETVGRLHKSLKVEILFDEEEDAPQQEAEQPSVTPEPEPDPETDEDPEDLEEHTCVECARTFTTARGLTMHEKTHEDDEE